VFDAFELLELEGIDLITLACDVQVFLAPANLVTGTTRGQREFAAEEVVEELQISRPDRLHPVVFESA